MAKVIGLIQVKGGAGRSTLATNLAGELARQGKVLLIDCDMPQGTSASWIALRKTSDVTPAIADNHIDLVQVIEAHQSMHDFIVLDGPPRIAAMTRAIMLLSDLTLIPIAASAAEIWATSDMVPIVEDARTVKPDLNINLVWIRYRGYTRSAKEISLSASRELGLRALKTKISYRVAYSDALAAGRTVTETTDKIAKSEIQALTREVIRALKSRNHRNAFDSYRKKKP